MCDLLDEHGLARFVLIPTDCHWNAPQGAPLTARAQVDEPGGDGHRQVVVRPGFEGQARDGHRRNGVDGQVIFRHGIEHQRVGDPGLVQGVDGLQDALSGVAFDELVGQIGSGGLAFRIEQVDLGGGPVNGLVDDDVQHLAEAVRTRGVEVASHALERVLVLLLQSDADDEGLDDDALRLEGPGDRAGVFVTGLDAVGDEQDDVALGALLVGKSSAARSRERAMGVVPWARSFLSSCWMSRLPPLLMGTTSSVSSQSC